MEPDNFVLTEAEKDSLKRKREGVQSPPSPPPTQQDELEESNCICADCGNYIRPTELGDCPYCIFREEHQDDIDEHAKMLQFVNGERGEDSGADHHSSEGEEDPTTTGLPDLHEYFMQFPAISDENVISMCRAYASYLASLSKKKIFKSPDPVISKKRRTRQTR